MEALFDEETAFESVNERISSEILDEILSHDESSSDSRLGSHVRKSEQGLRQKAAVVSSSLRQVIRASVFPCIRVSRVSFPGIEIRGVRRG